MTAPSRRPVAAHSAPQGPDGTPGRRTPVRGSDGRVAIQCEALFDLSELVTTPCARCHHEQATTRVHTRPDLQARNTWPYAVTGPTTVTSPPLHAGTDSAPMCDPCAAWLAAAWRSRHHAPCGATYDLWHVWTTPLTP